MRKALLLGLFWIATVVLAWFLGSNAGPRFQRAKKPQAREDRSTRPSRAQAARPARMSEPEPSVTPPAPERSAAEPVEPFSLDGVTSASELSDRLMEFAAAKLREGPEGHLEAYRLLDTLRQDRELLKRFFRDEEEAAALLYPWIKFLVNHESRVVALMETLYRTAAEDPQWYEGTDDDTLEIFAEGFAFVLPGAVGEETLARFRGYVERILEHPEESLPEAVRRRLRDFQRNLEWWAPPLGDEQIAAKLQDPAVGVNVKLALIERLGSKRLRGVDVSWIIEPALRRGNARAIKALYRVAAEPAAIAAYDGALLDGATTGKLHPHQVHSYLYWSGRRKWADARTFVEQGLRAGGKATDVFARVLALLRDKPDVEFVRSVIATYPLSQPTVIQLKRRFGIE